MALKQSDLKRDIEAAFKFGAVSEGGFPEIAEILATAIHVYVKTAEIKIPITTDVLGATGPCAVGAPAVIDGVIGVAKGTGIVQAGPGAALL